MKVSSCWARDRGGGGAGRAAAPPLFCAPAPTFCKSNTMILFLFFDFQYEKIIFNCQPSHFSPCSAVPVGRISLPPSCRMHSLYQNTRDRCFHAEWSNSDLVFLDSSSLSQLYSFLVSFRHFGGYWPITESVSAFLVIWGTLLLWTSRCLALLLC